MDYKKAREVFEAYLDGYDRENDKVQLKIVHTYGVIGRSTELARRMGLSEEDRELARIIALLHDIGRFEQIRRYDSFQPDTMDHALYGVKVLFEEGMIRDFVEDDRWDDIIRTAIAKHSDFRLEGIEDERTLLHARIIRDADKLDNCRVKLVDSFEALFDTDGETVGASAISPAVAEDAFSGTSVLSEHRETLMDYWVSYVAYFCDLNFKESFDIVSENDFVHRIIARVPYSNLETKATMEKLERFVTEYVQEHATH